MTCQNCVRRASKAIESVPGVVSANVDLADSTATVTWSASAAPNPEAVIKALQKTGFSATVITGPVQIGEERRLSHPWRLNIIVGFGAVIPLAIGEWVFHLQGKLWFGWVAFVLALIVQVVCGGRFYRGAWTQLKALSANMDTLVALGSTAAFGFSAYVLFVGVGGHLYFLESTSILSLISLGHWLEARATERATGALRALLQLAPSTARLIASDGSEIEIPVDNLRPGDRITVKPGDHLPIDGVVEEGRAAVDESMLTGEPGPVEKAPGHIVYGGTLNTDGRLIVRVSATGRETALARIISAVQRAQNSRAKIQRIGDRVSSVFVPVVVLVAIASGAWWAIDYDGASAVAGVLARYLWQPSVPSTAPAAAFINAVAVLIVACPCAMGLATPVAIMAATNAAARRGFLVRDGVALEKAGVISTVVFDKTGTLTRGRPTVTEIIDLRLRDEGGFVPKVPIHKIAASLAAPSNHLVSRAIAALDPSASDRGVVKQDPDGVTSETAGSQWVVWREVRGCGIVAKDKEQVWRMGSLSWLAEEGIALQGRIDPARVLPGESIVGIAVGNVLIGLFKLNDPPRDEAGRVVDALRAEGKRVCMITGDQVEAALAIAERIGIDFENVFARIKPDQKAAIIASLQQKGHRVAFVGDGINDAPALEQADLGIAVGRATDIARETADIVLLRSDLDAVVEALALARAALRIIKQNLFWAFFYNALAVPLAALGFLSPMVCAATMGLSDLIVIGNALRLDKRATAVRRRKR